MSIRKIKGIQSEFSILPNKTLNDSLSWGAKGLLAYLCSKPDDWKVSVQQLINHSADTAKPVKRDGTYALINELIDKGYIRRERTKGGGYSKTDYIVSPKPLTDNPDPVYPDPVEPTLQSKDIKQSKETNKTSKAGGVPYDDIADLYNSYIGDDFPKVLKVTDKRKALIRKFYSNMDKDIDKVKSYFEFFSDNAPVFYRGENNRNWKANFEYIIKEETVQKCREDAL